MLLFPAMWTINSIFITSTVALAFVQQCKMGQVYEGLCVFLNVKHSEI